MSMEHSPPVATTPSSTRHRGPRWANRLAIFAMLLFVLGPLGFIYGRAEFAAWHAARGMDSVWDGNYAAAIEHYDRALAWDAEESAYLTLRAQACLEVDRVAEAVKDSRRAVELAPDNSAVLHTYTTALVRAGKGDLAASLYEEKLPYLGVYDDSVRAFLQNNIAFILATANLDLDRAQKHIEEALELAPNEPSFIDTRAMVLYRKGEHEKALADMQKALGNPAQSLYRVNFAAKENSIDKRHRAYLERKGRLVVAQMLYHRALVHEALAAAAKDDVAKRVSHQIQAVTDRQKIRDLGYTPSEKLF